MYSCLATSTLINDVDVDDKDNDDEEEDRNNSVLPTNV